MGTEELYISVCVPMVVEKQHDDIASGSIAGGSKKECVGIFGLDSESCTWLSQGLKALCRFFSYRV